jgi:tetratricopeptide (TPR) repeat protein
LNHLPIVGQVMTDGAESENPGSDSIDDPQQSGTMRKLSMKVAFHLRRRPSAEPASAVLIETDRVDALLELTSKLGPDRSPLIHRVAGGFLLKLGRGVEPPPGPIRLRKLAENLYLPADADLVPALLDDEARGLTRNRGLIFLPGGKVLGFAPADHLPLSSLVRAERRDPSAWQPFPSRPERAERLVEIAFQEPELTGDDFLDQAVEPTEIGSEGPPRPEEVGPASTLAGRAAVVAGKGLIGLGAMLGIKSLADLGAKWINQAVERVPRLTEAILGKQEGALRELLRQFREGYIDAALRHALPLGGSGERGGTPSTEGKLPTVDPTYSLQSLLGSNRSGGGYWFGGFDVQVELAKEYRKAAEDAERRGDYRRAAYIHGKLLGDFATAAALLARGGLFRDAAYLHLNRLKDIPAAARMFEAAGEIDRALQLYRQISHHAEAGDLLRRVGEEEEAMAEYRHAANRLAVDPAQGPIAAGDLLRDRAGHPELALAYYFKGWKERTSTNAVACGLRMATIYADLGENDALVTLVNEADALFRHPGSESLALEFYNELASLAGRETLAEIREELRDRALMGLASKLRQQVAVLRRPGMTASTYFGRNKAWTPDLVGDANHATKLAVRRQHERRSTGRNASGQSARADSRRIVIGRHEETVTAACHAWSTGEIFLGFESGRVCRFNVANEWVSWLGEERVPISSMAVDIEGRTLVLLHGEGPEQRRLVHYSKVPSASPGWRRSARTVDGPGDFWLTPVMSDAANLAVGIWNGEEMILMGGTDDLALWTRLPMPLLKHDPPAAILIPPPDGKPPTPRAVLVHDGPDICQVETTGNLVRRRLLGWRPTLLEGNSLRVPPLAFIQVEPERFELTGLDQKGVIYWSSLKVNDSELIRTSNNESKGETIYSAATLVRPGMVAGVTRGRIDWLRCREQEFSLIGSTTIDIDAPIVCFPAPRNDELVVVCEDGTLVCVPTPR